MIGRIPVIDVRPVIGCGAWPAKAVVGESVPVSATVFREGHDAVAATLVVRGPDGAVRDSARMRPDAPGTDGWLGEFTPDEQGPWTFTVEGWADPYGSWRHAAEIKLPLGQDVELVCEEGALLLDRAAAGVPRPSRAALVKAARVLRDPDWTATDRLAVATDPDLLAVLDRHPLREFVTESGRHDVWVERPRALVGAWYEFFPRSEGASVEPLRSGTLATAMRRLPAIAAMGFDVVYLPPIHPIGHTFRKGPNNVEGAGPDDPGSPWAIGSPAGGHDAVHPDLGTVADFDRFVARAGKLGLEVAMDLALQCSPDHPWVTEHPEWFTWRPDGTVAYAENPPKKYQDIYPLNFDNDPEGIYQEVLRLVLHWVGHGVRLFRVDNPHTKPVPFWERLMAELRRTAPDVVLLAEAFTRPAMMHTLAKIGFSQSYTYFTWRNEKWELEEYLRELTGPAADYMRPNFFVNTPDILHAYLQYGGPPAFKIRAVLAALLSPSWGVYSGYELFEHIPVRPGSEEYLNSEKYQFRPRDWAAAERSGRSLAPFLTTLNRFRQAHPACQRLRPLHLHPADQPEIMVWSKRQTLPDGGEDVVLVVVNLDPHGVREATVSLDMPALGADWDDRLQVHDELTGLDYEWGESNYVRLDPFVEPAHVFSVRRT
jgi:starch synthase (maltosyl-transferring)